MKKQRNLFTLAAITAVSGAAAMAGCGDAGKEIVYVTVDAGERPPDARSEPPPPVPTADAASDGGPVVDGAPDATVDGGADASADATVDASVDGAADAGPTTCPVTAPIDATSFPWKPPAQTVGACTPAELDAFVAYVDVTADPQLWRGGPWTTNPTCRDCVFAMETTVWPPMILNAAGELSELNVGGCIALKSGKDGCGRAYQQWRACYLEACADCPAGDGVAFSKCVTAANKVACKKAFDDVLGPTACEDVQTAADAETACDGMKYVFEGPIKAQCIEP